MSTTSTERQAAYRARMRSQGYTQVLLWVQPDRKFMLEYFADYLRNATKEELSEVVQKL